MESKNQLQLEEAKAFFYSWKMVEAYNIFRRYFDRIPFKPEKEHAEYIGIFARILVELGKEYELKFYVGELERHYRSSKIPTIAYPLAVVYVYLQEPRWESAKAIFENIISQPDAGDYRAKSKMMLAHYYDDIKQDISACRQIIFSIEKPTDPKLNILVDIWKAKVLRDEKKFEEAEGLLLKLLNDLTPTSDWYAYFNVKNILANLYIQNKAMDKAATIIVEIKQLFKGKHFRSVQVELSTLEKLLKNQRELDSIQLIQGEKDSVLSYADKTLLLKSGHPSEKLMVLLAKKKFLDKALIIQTLYSRTYDAKRDDQLIYYHIHSLRKCLKSIGLPSEAILNESDGYRLVPPVQTVGGAA